MGPDWRIAAHYSALARAERKALAWEWLRRTETYRRRWHDFIRGRCSCNAASELGLARFEDPDFATPAARPIWLASVDPGVVSARILSHIGCHGDLVDLFTWRDLVSIEVDDDEIEHLLLSDGSRSLRLDVIAGTLLGCPARLAYDLDGIEGLRHKLSSLQSLISAKALNQILSHIRTDRILDRWIQELRVADALEQGSSQHEIARVLYGATVPNRHWRATSDSYRLRAQRLVRRVRLRLKQPLTGWFTE